MAGNIGPSQHRASAGFTSGYAALMCVDCGFQGRHFEGVPAPFPTMSRCGLESRVELRRLPWPAPVATVGPPHSLQPGNRRRETPDIRRLRPRAVGLDSAGRAAPLGPRRAHRLASASRCSLGPAQAPVRRSVRGPWHGPPWRRPRGGLHRVAIHGAQGSYPFLRSSKTARVPPRRHSPPNRSFTPPRISRPRAG
jgi:hypothetical protein